MIKNHRDVIDLWPSVDVMAADCGLPIATIRVWKHRNRIPSRVWGHILKGAKRRNYGITADVLLKTQLSAQ